ncbi:MAG: SprB repeat-containing protein, partial [Bacteroidia bacterium]|nr:SprB repeat-containing protein [Bacteroidia bacterium]
MNHIYKVILAFITLSASLQLQSQCTGFYDGFESGSYTPTWQMGTGTYTTTVPNTGSAVGTYNLQNASTVANSFYQGVYTIFTPQQPTYCSWWMKTNTTNVANGYVVIGNSNIATDNGIIFCYFNASSQLRFFNTAGYNHPITANTWYHIEARNMNWTSRTCDIYIDNVLILTSWAFRSTTAANIDRIHCFSLNAATANYDEFVIGSVPVTATSTSTNNLCAGDNNGSASVTASGGNGVYTYSWAPSGGTGASASGLAAGTYSCTITDGVGCSVTQTVSITEPLPLQLTAVPSDVLCNGGFTGSIDASVTGGTGTYTYLWSNAAMTEDVSGLGVGTYSLYVVDANNCVDS